MMVFNFTSIEEDFEPYIEELRRHTNRLNDEDYRRWYSELIDKLQHRCDSKYAKGDVVATSMLFADEAATFMHMLSYILIVV